MWLSKTLKKQRENSTSSRFSSQFLSSAAKSESEPIDVLRQLYTGSEVAHSLSLTFSTDVPNHLHIIFRNPSRGVQVFGVFSYKKDRYTQYVLYEKLQ